MCFTPRSPAAIFRPEDRDACLNETVEEARAMLTEHPAEFMVATRSAHGQFS
jgi:hypothetical protein